MCYDLTNLAQIILPDGITFRQEVDRRYRSLVSGILTNTQQMSGKVGTGQNISGKPSDMVLRRNS